MDKLSLEWKEKFEHVWEAGNYRLGSTGQRLVPLFLEYVTNHHGGVVINDYGCGTGRADVDLHRCGINRINMVDIAENALEPAARAILGNEITFTLASLWELPEDFPFAHWGFCTNVLMTIPPEKIDRALMEIWRTCDNLFMEVYDWADIRLGHDLTATKGSGEWWRERLAAFWATVKPIKSIEDHRRYIFVCNRCRP